MNTPLDLSSFDRLQLEKQQILRLAERLPELKNCTLFINDVEELLYVAAEADEDLLKLEKIISQKLADLKLEVWLVMGISRISVWNAQRCICEIQ